jgi:hypothetical protein
MPVFPIVEPWVLPSNSQNFFSTPLALCFPKMLFRILLACLGKMSAQGSKYGYAWASNFCRLADFLANFLPLVVFVFFDGVEESYALLSVSNEF